MKTVMLLAAAVSLSSLWQQMTRPTNSKAAAGRGVIAYERQKYGDATSQFASAASNDPSSQNLFNLGTAQIAAGQRTEGAATLTKAMEDPELRPRALFNRGNSALAANALDHAIRDYTEVLKLAPKDAEAKRNLEIALRRKQSMQQQQEKRPSQSPQPQEQQPQPRPGEKQEQRGQPDAEALLRSVQQQEQEELARMKRSRSDSRRVGW